MQRGSLSPPWLRKLCPSMFLPMLQSPMSQPHPNIWMDINPHQQVTHALVQFQPSTSITLLCPLLSQHLLQKPGKWRAQGIRRRSHEKNVGTSCAPQAPGCAGDPCALSAATLSRSDMCCDTEKDSFLQTSRPGASFLPFEGSLGDVNFLQGMEVR